MELRDALERDLRKRQEEKRKLNEAFIYREAVSETDYQQMKRELEQEILTLEMKVNEAKQDEIEIEQLLDFAENLLLDAAGTWDQSGLEQKQRLQQVLFPRGIAYSNGQYRTAATNPMFNMLQQPTAESGQLVALTGIEPVFQP